MKVFREKGYHNASIRDIAAMAGIQKGSVYYYVASKEDLLADVLERELELLTKPLKTIASSDLPSDEKLRQAIANHMSFAAEHLDALAVVVQDLHSLSPEKRAGIVAKRDHYETVFRSIIEEGVQTGVFGDTDVKLATFAILGMCNYAFLWFSGSGRLSPEEIAKYFADTVLNGLLAAGNDEVPRQTLRLERQLTRHTQALRNSLETFQESQLVILSEMQKELSGASE